MTIPFSLPLIDQEVIAEMLDTLTNTGWVTTGPKTKELEIEIKKISMAKEVLCVNSWSSGAMLILRWFGIGPGDEVIIPAYTYCATALSVLNVGATPVMVDVNYDFTIDVKEIEKVISKKTKAIIPVDLGGLPCKYREVHELINEQEIKCLFQPSNDRQLKLNRVLVLSDAAHSFGATYHNMEVGTLTDISVLSFHSAKNITTGEGGAVLLNLPEPFNNKDEINFLRAFSLNGQNKSAFEKNKIGGWKYDIIDQGLKINMPDLCAAMGLAQIRKYKGILLPERKNIFDYYNSYFSKFDWAIIPPSSNDFLTSSYHLYLLRIKGISEHERDKMINLISESGVGVNVHYIPMPMLTLFKRLGYKIEHYPKSYELYCNEITLPVYNGLTSAQLSQIVNSVFNAYKNIL